MEDFMKKMVILVLFCLMVFEIYAQGREWEAYAYSLDLKRNLFVTGDRSSLDYELGITSLLSFTKEELRILRNYIFARYNYSFSSPDLIEFFSKYGWYRASENNVDNRLNEIDRGNIQLIQELESNFPSNNDAERVTGIWRLRGAIPSEGYTWGDYIIIYSNGTYERKLRNFNAVRTGDTGQNIITGGSVYGIWTTGGRTSSGRNLIIITNIGTINGMSMIEARINNDLWWQVSNNPLNYRYDWGSR
jgi:hypothetical protein